MSNFTVCHHLRNLFLSLLMFLGLAILNSVISKPVSAQNKVGVNITDNFSQIDRAVSMVNSDGQSNGGWVVLMPKIGNCTDVSNIVKDHQGKVNFIIRLHYPDTVPEDNYALSWASTLVKIAEQTEDVIYVYPWNEPNMPRECGGRKDCTALVRQHVAKLREYLEEYGLWQTKIKVLSPMMNQSGDNFQTSVNALGSSFFSQFEGQVMNLYDFQRETGHQACRQTNPNLNACTFEPVLSQVPGGQTPAYGVETGIVDESGTCPKEVTDCPFFEDSRMLTLLREAYDNHWFNNPNIAMASPLFYNPEISTHPVWLWGSQSERYLKEVARRRSGSTSIASFNATGANSKIEQLISDGTLIQCGNSCGVATSEDLCTAASGSTTFDLSIYDEYDADPDSFYVHPIKGLEVPYASRSVTTIRNDMITQGYEAHCATPQFKIKLNQEGEAWMETLLADRNEGTSNLDVRPKGIVFGGDILYQKQGLDGKGHEDLPYRSVLTVDYRNTLLPVFRDVTGKRWLTTSLEEYFGFSDIKIGDRSLAEINSAPINSLLSRTNYCTQALTILTKQEEMCQKIQDSNKCALYLRPIPDSSFPRYTVKTLLDDYKEFFDDKVEDYELYEEDKEGNRTNFAYSSQKGLDKFCLGMVSQKDLDENFMTAVKNTPLNIDRAYRLGFLVTEIEMIYPSINNMFSLFEHPNAGFLGGVKNPQDAVLVNAFKIPDFGTNKGGAERLTEPLADSTAGNVFWPDAAWLTRNSLMTQSDQIDYEATASAKRNTLLTTALQYDVDRPTATVEKDEIFCNVGVGTTGVGAPECQDPLSRATIDIVNATAQLSELASTDSPTALELQNQGFDQFQPECPTLGKEVSTQISDPATLQPVTDPSKVYTTQFGADLLDKLFKDSTHEIDKRGSKKDPSFAETWRDREPFGTLARKYGDEDDPVDEIEDHWGGLTDWGLKSVFHVVNETLATKFPNDCCKDMRKVKHYLVYPVGYDLQTVQTVLAGSFFTTDELISLAEAAEEYDRIQVSGDLVNFEGAKKDVTFEDNSFFSDSRVFRSPNWPLDADVTICDGEGTPALDGCVVVADKLDIAGNCTEVTAQRRVNPNSLPAIYRTVTVGWRLPCTRDFKWEVVKEGETLSAGILGGKLGFYLREIQKVLNTKASDARQYLDTCKTTEQFLRGQCGSGEGLVPTPTPDTCTELSCMPPPAPPGPPASGSGTCVELRIRGGQVYAYNKCDCALGDWQLQDGSGGLWCGPFGQLNTLFPHTEVGPLCYHLPTPSRLCASIDAPGNPPQAPQTCITSKETVCVDL